jgi:hypothetical protein
LKVSGLAKKCNLFLKVSGLVIEWKFFESFGVGKKEFFLKDSGLAKKWNLFLKDSGLVKK